MPITKSAQKALKIAVRKQAINQQHKKALKEVTKEIQKQITIEKDSAKKLLPKAYSIIDKAAKRGVIKKNTASRKKARLSKITK